MSNLNSCSARKPFGPLPSLAFDSEASRTQKGFIKSNEKILTYASPEEVRKSRIIICTKATGATVDISWILSHLRRIPSGDFREPFMSGRSGHNEGISLSLALGISGDLGRRRFYACRLSSKRGRSVRHFLSIIHRPIRVPFIRRPEHFLPQKKTQHSLVVVWK